MTLRPYAISPAICIVAALSASPAHAVGLANIAVSAAPSVLIADGKSNCIITATIRGTDGQLVPDGTPVSFTTTLGTLDHSSVTTVSGVARVQLTSAPSEGKAVVTVNFFGASSGAGTSTFAVNFTSDRDLAATDGDSRWVRIDCPQYLIYSADGHIVDAQGKHGSATLHVGALSVVADSIQYDLDNSSILARNAVFKRGPYSITAAEIRYDLYGNTGVAVIAATKDRTVHSVSIDGLSFITKDLSGADIDDMVDNNRFRPVDLSTSRVVLSAKSISIDPGSVIQFKHATLYSDGKKVVSMPLHVMPLNTDQLFGEQVVGFSSSGLFLNLPYYYHLTPGSTGTIYLRNSAAATAGIATSLAPTFGSQGTRPGLALDLQQTYRAGSGGNGSLVLNGLTQSGWGGSFNHSQKFDSSTSGYFLVDSPNHRSLFGSSTLTRKFKGFSANFSAVGNRDPGFDGYSYTSNIMSSYIQTDPMRLHGLPINSAFDFTVQRGFTRTTAPNSSEVTSQVATQSIDARFYSNPMHPDKQSTVTDSLTIGRSWSKATSKSAFNVIGTLGLDKQLAKKGHLNINYNYRYDPLLSQIGSESGNSAAYSALSPGSVQQDVSATFMIMPSKKSQVSFSTHYALPYNSTTVYSMWNYQANRDWAFTSTGFWSSYFGRQYTSMQFGVSRRIFNRSIQLTYDTSMHKFLFDFGAGQF